MKSPAQVPTIYDIARIAGVSANTVSRAINGKAGVKDSTRGRILTIAQDLGYYPNLGAQSLRTKREGIVGLTIPAPVETVPISQANFTFLFTELYRIFSSRGERICFDLNPFVASAHGDYARSVWQRFYGACIVAGPLATGDRVIERIHRSGIPYVAFSRLDSLAECSTATVDMELGAYQSTKVMMDRGHRRIAILKSLSGYQPGVERRRGYLRALDEGGITFDATLIQSVAFRQDEVINAVHRLLKDQEVTALIDASGLEDGSSILEGARRAGRKLGKDVDVLCWTYTSDTVVLEQACMHLWIPIREATTEGLERLAEWYFGTREGPVRALYPPTMLETKDIQSRPSRRYNRLFDALF